MKRKKDQLEPNHLMIQEPSKIKNNSIGAEAEFIKLAKQIRVNYKSADEHIELLEEIVENQLSNIAQFMLTKEQSEIYFNFKQEFEQMKVNHLLSYKWWILFCYRLSILITPLECRTNKSTDIKSIDTFVDRLLTEGLWLSHESFLKALNEVDPFKKNGSFYAYSLRNLIQKFPDVIMMPTTEGDISPHDFNMALVYNVIPLRIVNSQGIYADGQFFYADRFFRHDLGHASNWFLSDNDYHSDTIQLFIETILHQIELSSDVRKKSQLDFMLFFMTHEFPLFFYIADLGHLKEWILRPQYESQLNLYDACMNKHWYGPLIKPYLPGKDSFEKEMKEYVDESILLTDNLIKEFFTTYSIKDFREKAIKPRNYRIKEPLTQNEITKHWTYSNEIAKTDLTKKYGSDYTASPFFHYLVKKDPIGPNYQKFNHEKVAVFSHMISQQGLFKQKIAHAKHHREHFKNDDSSNAMEMV